MDFEKLITLVKERSEIYNPKHPLNRNRYVLTNVWKNIAEKLHTTDTEARNKWQNLRSNYMREKRKLGSSASGSPADGSPAPRWPYFAMLSFLDESIKHRKSHGNISTLAGDEAEIENSDSDQDSDNDCDQDSDHARRTDASNSSILNAVLSANRTSETADDESSSAKKRKKNSSRELVLADRIYLKQLGRIASTSPEDNNPDFLFFKSLLPEMSKLGFLEKLEFKSEVIQLLKRKLNPAPNQFLYSNPSSVGTASPYDFYSQRQDDGHSLQHHCPPTFEIHGKPNNEPNLKSPV